jgi:hypothetical protein
VRQEHTALPGLSRAVLAACLVVVVVGCGSSSQSTSSSPTPAAAASPSTKASASSSTAVTVSDAALTRDKLLAAAPVGSAVPNRGEMAQVWQTVVPGVRVSGSGIAATPGSISGFAFVLSKKKGLQYLAFAVLDSSGKCADGVLEASGSGDKVTAGLSPAHQPGSCSGSRVADTAGY